MPYLEGDIFGTPWLIQGGYRLFARRERSHSLSNLRGDQSRPEFLLCNKGRYLKKKKKVALVKVKKKKKGVVESEF